MKSRVLKDLPMQPKVSDEYIASIFMVEELAMQETNRSKQQSCGCFLVYSSTKKMPWS
jgi:hypothetical protein